MGAWPDHYEGAFESYLRSRRIPYVAVDEARRALAPMVDVPGSAPAPGTLKSFDFVVSGPSGNLLVDVKGRKAVVRGGRSCAPDAGLDSWVTREDIESLSRWQTLFGPGFDAAFVFLFERGEQPPDGLFEDVFEHRGRWYIVRVITLARYAGAMRERSPKWRTVYVPRREFERLSVPLRGVGSGAGAFNDDRTGCAQRRGSRGGRLLLG